VGSIVKRRILQNHPGQGWYWEIVAGHEVMARGLADTHEEACLQAAEAKRERQAKHAGNHFLASLSSQDNELLQAHLHHPQQLSTGTVIYDVDDTIPRVIFPYNGIISVVVALSGGQYIEAGMLGRNSVVGVAAALDGPTAFNRAIVQGDGTATAIDAAVLKRLADQSKTLRHSLVQHDHAAQAQTQQVAACPAHAGVLIADAWGTA
jgi:CRP-like cAMP-binding protein